jgi:ribosomal protein L37AE/L43A
MGKRFSKKQEDFVCEHCDKKVKGDGYTNHCPFCLWSKHVDENPGDRAEMCGGQMKPTDIYLENQDWVLIHECQRCGAVKRNRLAENDDMDVVIALQKKISERKTKK